MKITPRLERKRKEYAIKYEFYGMHPDCVLVPDAQYREYLKAVSGLQNWFPSEDTNVIRTGRHPDGSAKP